ncbi:MAG: hypothetical protein LIQ31_02100, partial [Planctomycetes bacterium]|nr:hypothetical protein [Planctomycetota bacterium]
SLDLHLGIARLYLEELPPDRQNPAKAATAAQIAATLSQNSNPAALELLALALHRDNRNAAALNAINAAITVKSSRSRIALREAISAALFPEEVLKDVPNQSAPEGTTE